MLTPDLIRGGAIKSPDRPAMIASGQTRTFAEADRAADEAASAMLESGLNPGDRVALLAHNELEYLELQAACDRARLILLPLNQRLSVPELEYILSDAQPRLLISGRAMAETAAKLDVEAHWYLGKDGPGLPYDRVRADARVQRFEEHGPAETPSVIMYSSGTTGRPKGALINRGAVWIRAVTTAIEAGVRPGDRFVQGLPMFHISAQHAYGWTINGGTIACPEGAFDADAFPEFLAQMDATHCLVVPTMINWMTARGQLGRQHLPSLQMIDYGASPIASDVLERAMSQTNAGFLQMYGMTETFGTSILRPADHVPGSPHLSSAGTETQGTRIRIVDADGNDLPAGEIGEIWSRGPALMDCYWNNPKATEEALAGGWMHTGDVGYRDEAGYVFLSDRLSDMIISGGENVYPRELEDVLIAHPDVFEVAVIGIPDERWGERVHAMIVAHDAGRANLAEIEAYARGNLAGYKVPKSWELVAELPKNATGKIMKKELRKRIAERS